MSGKRLIPTGRGSSVVDHALEKKIVLLSFTAVINVISHDSAMK